MKNVKRILSMILAGIVMTVCSGIVAFAATEHKFTDLTVGIPYTFEGSTASIVADSGDVSHGKAALISVKDDVLTLCDFKIENQVAVVSFDIWATQGTDIQLEITPKRYADPGSWAHNTKWGEYVEGSLKDNSGTMVGNYGSVPASKWHHFELKMDLTGTDGNDTDVYIDGTYKYSFDANAISNKDGALSLGALKWRAIGITDSSDKFMVDNVCVKASGEVTATGKMTSDGIVIDFVEDMPELSASDFTVTQTAQLKDAESINVTDFEIDQSDGAKVVLKGARIGNGFKYNVSMNGKKTALGNDVICDISLDGWNFERNQDFESYEATGKAKIEEDTIHGKYLTFTDTVEYGIGFQSELKTTGKYVVGADFMLSTLSGDSGYQLRFWGDADQNCFGEISYTDRTLKDPSGKVLKSSLSTEKWYHIDFLVDLDNKLCTAYLDNQKVGNTYTISISSMDRLVIRGRGAAGSIDNLTVYKAANFDADADTFNVGEGKVTIGEGAINVSYDVEYGKDDLTDAYIIYAAYDDGTLIGADFSPIKINKFGAISHLFEDADALNYTTIKGFLWENFDTLKPFAAVAN